MAKTVCGLRLIQVVRREKANADTGRVIYSNHVTFHRVTAISYVHYARHHSTFNLPHRAFEGSVEAYLQFYIEEETLGILGGWYDFNRLHYVAAGSLFCNSDQSKTKIRSPLLPEAALPCLSLCLEGECDSVRIRISHWRNWCLECCKS